MNLSLDILYVHVSVLMFAIDTAHIEEVLANPLNWFEDFVSTFITISPGVHLRLAAVVVTLPM